MVQLLLSSPQRIGTENLPLVVVLMLVVMVMRIVDRVVVGVDSIVQVAAAAGRGQMAAVADTAAG